MGAAPAPSDERLAAEAAGGSLDAFNQIVDRYQRPVFALCYRLLGDSHAAEDAAQETFLSAFRAVRSFTGSNVRGWLFRIAANASKDELRRRSRKGGALSFESARGDDDVVIDPPDPAESPEQHLERIALGAELQEALDSLPFDQRQAIVYVDALGFRYEEVAELTGSSVGTVKSRIHRGRERLRHYLEQHGTISGGSAF